MATGQEDPAFSTPDLPAGTRLGDFEIVRTLGEGGFSRVYVATDHSLGRTVALKEYLPSALATRGTDGGVVPRSQRHADVFAAGLRSFINEARLLAQFDHPSLVKVYRFWEAQGTAYMVMPLYKGTTLKQALQERADPPDEDWMLGLLKPLIEALSVLHAEHVFHRDIAPDNVLLLEGTGRPLLLDFGAARRVIGDMTQAMTVILKPGYAPVEQYAEIPEMRQGPWTDVYALACVVHYALLQKTPPPSVGRLVQDSYVPLTTRLAGLCSDGFLRAIDHALEVRPDRRTQDMPQFATELGLMPPGEAGDVAMMTRSPGTARVPDNWAPTARPPDASASVARTVSPSSRPTPAAPARRGGWLSALAALWTSSRGAAPPAPPPVAPARQPPAEDSGRTLIRLAPAPVKEDAPAANLVNADRTVLLRAAVPAGGEARLAMQLVVVSSADKALIGAIFPVQQARVEIGREAPEVRLADATVSARHAAIVAADGGYALIDMGSSNGTFLNGRRLTPMQREALWLGASIRLGDSVLSFVQRREGRNVDLTGATLADIYELQRCLRDSAKGALYAATHKRTGSSMAIKLLAQEIVDYPGYRAHFERVMAAAKRLQHPHISILLDSGLAEVVHGSRRYTTAFLCYPLLAGGNLADLLAANRATPPAQVGTWVSDIASALTHAHRQQMVHGDLKPSAICFDADQQVYVTDFAAAGSADSGAALFGAPAYVAPEQWQGEPADAATDQFALAALAYAMLTGGRPFEGQEDPRVRERNFRRPPIPAHQEALANGRTAFPAAVSEVLRRALAPRRAERFQSLAAFASALSTALAGKDRGYAASHVFISYKRGPSTSLALLIARELRDRQSLTVYLDSQAGGAYALLPDELERAVKSCAVFVCLLAPGTLESDWVRSEIELAHKLDRPSVPVFHGGLSRRQVVAGNDAALARLVGFVGPTLEDQDNAHMDEDLATLGERIAATVARVIDV